MKKTKFPIIFIHGAVTGRHFLNWNVKSIAKTLNKLGYDNFYYIPHDAFASVKQNCEYLQTKIEEIITKTNAEKVNLIGYSKGGLEARYLAYNSSLKDKIASISLYATPNQGLAFADWFLKKKKRVFFNIVFKIFQPLYLLFKDKQCDIVETVKNISSENMKKFNEIVKDNSTVYYQSFLTISKSIFDNLPLFLFNCITSKIIKDEPHDGFVNVTSAKWGEFHLFENSKHMTHLNVIGFFARRKSTIPNFIHIMDKLISKGY